MKPAASLNRIACIVSILLAGIFTLSSLQAAAPAFRWAQSAGGEGREYGDGIALDASGNTHVIGRFLSDPMSIGSTTLTNGGLFLAKYSTNGTVLYARQINTTPLSESPGNNLIFHVAADAAGNTYVSGSLPGGAPRSITFENVTLTTSAEDLDLFLAKYDASGNLLWARKADSTGADSSIRASAMTVDTAGNCYLTGDYISAPDLGLTNVPPAFINFYAAKFDTSGNLVWARTIGYGVPSPDRAIAVDNAGGYFVSGMFQAAPVTFDSVTLTNIGPSHIFVVHYDAAGNLLWAKRAGGSGTDQSVNLGTDALGNCYLNFQGSAATTFDNLVVTNGGNCLAKYAPNGNVLWCSGTITNVLVRQLGVDALGNCFLFGLESDPTTFGGVTLTNGSFIAPANFVAKLDSDGHPLWAKDFGGADDEFNASIKGAIAVNAQGNCSVTGFIRVTNSLFDAFSLSPVSDDEDVYVAFLEADSPSLNLTRTTDSVILSWPTNQSNFKLESTTDLVQPTVWSPVTNTPSTSGIQYFVTNSITADNRFYRLRKE